MVSSLICSSVSLVLAGFFLLPYRLFLILLNLNVEFFDQIFIFGLLQNNTKDILDGYFVLTPLDSLLISFVTQMSKVFVDHLGTFVQKFVRENIPTFA